MIWPKFSQNPFWISGWYPNAAGWIRAQGFALLIFSKPHFSGLWFDTQFKSTIRFRYPFGIWNSSRNFENFDYLNISVGR
jgi:hypothetical protein